MSLCEEAWAEERAKTCEGTAIERPFEGLVLIEKVLNGIPERRAKVWEEVLTENRVKNLWKRNLAQRKACEPQKEGH